VAGSELSGFLQKVSSLVAEGHTVEQDLTEAQLHEIFNETAGA
jgi:hypothetical protein